MMNSQNTFILPYSKVSQGAKALCKNLELLRYGFDFGSIPKYNADPAFVIHWGNSNYPYDLSAYTQFNPMEKLKKVSGKVSFFKTMSAGKDGPRIPEWTTDASVALEWAKAGDQVVGRATTTGTGGKGIHFYDNSELQDFLGCKLWTKYVKNKGEYRVHFAFGEVIDRQKKALRKDADPEKIGDKRVKSHRNGYVFIRQNVVYPTDVMKQAELAMQKSGLDFGALDIVYNEYYDKAYVLEVNTAPGLEGSTVDSYANAFRKRING